MSSHYWFPWFIVAISLVMVGASEVTEAPVIESDQMAGEAEFSSTKPDVVVTANDIDGDTNVNGDNKSMVTPKVESTATTMTTSNSESTTMSTVPQTTTTTTVAPSSSTVLTSSPFFCPCDYHFNSCDFNCCCDLDCSSESKATFSTCVDAEAFAKISESRSIRRCIQQEFVVRNTTLFKTEITRSGQFCVVRENLKIEEEFPAAKLNFDKISKLTTSKFFWHFTSDAEEYAQAPSKSYYKYGHQIQVASKNGSVNGYLRAGMYLPSPAFSLSCNSRSPVTFLQNKEFSCRLSIFNLSRQCETEDILNATNWISSSRIISNPSLTLDLGKFVNITFCPPPTTSDKSTCQESTTLRSPQYEPSTSTCSNVLSQLQLIFKHNGTEGIVHVIAHVYYANYTSQNVTVRQKFSSIFEWHNPAVDNVHRHPLREVSGNPGYLLGRPVLTGSLDNVKKEQVPRALRDTKVIHPYKVDPLTVLNPRDCFDPARKRVVFGYDLSVTCLLPYVNLDTCHNLTATIGTILFGTYPSTFMARYVATLGDPQLAVKSHWIPWTTFEEPFKTVLYATRKIDSGCDALVTAVHLHLVYSRTGSVHFPQLTILGAYVHFGGSTTIPPKNVSVTIDSTLWISTTVKFTDVTPPATTPIPKWPAISIRLPQDFFYPFSIASDVVGIAQFPSVFVNTLVILVGKFVIILG